MILILGADDDEVEEYVNIYGASFIYYYIPACCYEFATILN